MKASISAAAALTVIGSLAATTPRAAAGGAWAQPRGHLYAKVSGIFYGADEVYDDMGSRRAMGMDGDRFDGRQAFLYLEYGARQRLTLVARLNAGLLVDESRLVRSETAGIGDVEVGLKYQAVDRPVVLAPMLSLKVPTGYHDDFEPPLGTGEADVEARLLASRSFYPLPLYAGAEGAYRLRGGAFSDQLACGAELGLTPHPRWFAKVSADATDTRSSGSGADAGLVGGSTQVSEGDFTKVGASLAARVADGLWLEVLVERVVRGQNVGAGSSLGVGFAVRR